MTSDNAQSPPELADPDEITANALERAPEGQPIGGRGEVDWDRIRGRAAPRLWTRPLRPLTRETSYGYRFMDWCSERSYPLDPWERWVAIHVGELLPDGRPRFRRVVIIVARQNGKTLLLKLLILWWAYEDAQLTILMTSTNLDYARAALFEAAEMAGAEVNMPRGFRRMPGLQPPAIRQANGQERLTAPSRQDDDGFHQGGTFMIAAAKGDSAGRSLTINRLVMDEIREHKSWSPYNAAMHTLNAVRDAQAFFVSNQGDATSVVLRGLRASAMTGQDRRLGLFEYSCPEGSRPDDLAALAYANPNLGYRIDPETLLGEAVTAMQQGGEALTKFKTEIMCLDVPVLDPAIDMDAWRDCAEVVELSGLRRRLAACLDVSPDGEHATLVVAAVDREGIVRVEVVREWTSAHLLRRSLALTVKRVQPKVFGWFPNGPAAAVAADLAAPKQRRSAAWPPPGVEVREIRAEVPAVCMGFEELVRARGLRHPNDELLTAQVGDTQRQQVGDVWVFGRRDAAGPIDAAYAAAGAAHLARLLPEPPRVRTLRTPS